MEAPLRPKELEPGLGELELLEEEPRDERWIVCAYTDLSDIQKAIDGLLEWTHRHGVCF